MNGPTKKKPHRERVKRAQLFAESVSVVCPECGADQPNPDGSMMWLPGDFQPPAQRRCVSCDVKLLVTSETKVQF